MITQKILNLLKITANTLADGNTKNVEIFVPLKCLINFWRPLEMPLINREVNLTLTWWFNLCYC